MYNIKKIWKRI